MTGISDSSGQGGGGSGNNSVAATGTSAPGYATQVGYDNSSGNLTAVSITNLLPTQTGGTTGLDYSSNQPALPNVGANFSASGIYANYFLLTTVPALPSRNNIDIENISGAQIAVVRDDGTAANGSAPANASVFSLAGGAGSGQQGGAWSSQTFKGRLQIYAPSSSAIVTVMVD